MSDEDHLDFARDNGYVVLTEDQDFLMLAATRPDHGGVIYARQGKKIGDVIRGVLLVTDTLVATEMVGQVEHPTRPGTVTIAGKQSVVMPAGTVKNVLKQAGLTD